ncbi:MAG: hypothetical protein SXV54_15075 [Chloroflexota bacterium]|nr:hypothetical protein [Chloroflexota bacterium]
MKYSRLILSLTLVCLLLSTMGCGSGEPIIETPAGEMNFAVADLGSEWSLVEDQGLDDMQDMNQAHIRDASLRMFGADAITGFAMSILFTTKTVASAEEEMKGATVQSFVDSIQEQVPGATFETLEPPSVGDEASMVGGGHPDLGLNIYMLVFRKANVIAMFSLIGSADSVTEETVADYAQKLEAKVQ